MIRTRFAPSPTGELHIGGARTALFAYLFAKSQGGDFLLRIEDTDRERFVEGATDRIIESLKWLGIVPDNIEKPMIQSERAEIHREHAYRLLSLGKAYVCKCSQEELELARAEQIKKGLPPKYDGKCRDKNYQLPDDKSGFVIRMKIPQKGEIEVDDMIRGDIKFDASLIDDQVILKSDGFATYHLASVVDDHDMGITHVIRSDEWLSSTPKHVFLYKSFNWKIPKFAHLSMILGEDKRKLSKRRGATPILDYRDKGYLSGALINYIALLGWNPKDEREFFTLLELKEEFKIKNVNISSAIHSSEKLNSINSHYLKETDLQDLKIKLKEVSGLDFPENQVELIKRGGYNTLVEAVEYLNKLNHKPDFSKSILIFSKSNIKKTSVGLGCAQVKIKGVGENSWNADILQGILENVVREEGLSNGDVFWPVRVALSGEEKSPSPVELLVALGKEESLKRVKKAINKLH